MFLFSTILDLEKIEKEEEEVEEEATEQTKSATWRNAFFINRKLMGEIITSLFD